MACSGAPVLQPLEGWGLRLQRAAPVCACGCLWVPVGVVWLGVGGWVSGRSVYLLCDVSGQGVVRQNPLHAAAWARRVTQACRCPEAGTRLAGGGGPFSSCCSCCCCCFRTPFGAEPVGWGHLWQRFGGLCCAGQPCWRFGREDAAASLVAAAFCWQRSITCRPAGLAPVG
jgi:hypothetical protein